MSDSARRSKIMLILFKFEIGLFLVNQVFRSAGKIKASFNLDGKVAWVKDRLELPGVESSCVDWSILEYLYTGVFGKLHQGYGNRRENGEILFQLCSLAS